MVDLATLTLKVQSLEVLVASQRMENAALKARVFDRNARQLSKTGTNLAGTFRRVINTLGPLVGILGTFGAIRAAGATLVQFGESMAIVRGIAIRTTETLAVQEAQFQSLNETAKELGATSIFTANQVAQSELFLARAGFTTQEILTALPTTLDLATAGVIDLGRAADIVTNTLSQFNLEADQIGQAGDVIVKTANSSNTSVLQLAEALKFGGPLAGALGVSLNEAAAALGIFGDAGIQASLAGTQLRGIFSALVDPSKEALSTFDQLAERLGTTRSVFDITSNSLEDVFRAFQQANTSAQEFVKIFQRRQSAGAIILSRDIDKFAELAQATREATGESERLANIQRETLRGSFLALKSAVEGLVLELGESGAAGALQVIVELSTSVIRAFTGFQDRVERFKVVAVGLAAALRAVAAALAAIAAIKILTFLGSLLTAGSALLATFEAFSLLMAGISGPIGIAAVAIAGLVGAFTILVPAVSDAISGLQEVQDSVINTEFRVNELKKATEEYDEAVRNQDFSGQEAALRRQGEVLIQTTREIREGVSGLTDGGGIAVSDVADLIPSLNESELSDRLRDQLLRSFERGVERFGAEAASAQILTSSRLPEAIQEEFSQLARLADQAARAGTSLNVGGAPIDELVRDILSADSTEIQATGDQTIRIINEEIDRIRRAIDIAEFNEERAPEVVEPPIDPEQVVEATESLNKFIQAQQRETELLGLNATEREIANAQRAAQDLLDQGAVSNTDNLLRKLRELIQARADATEAAERESAAIESQRRARDRSIDTVNKHLRLLEREANLLDVNQRDRGRVREQLEFQEQAVVALNGSQENAARLAANFRSALERLDQAAFLEDLSNRLGGEIGPALQQLTFEVENTQQALEVLDQLALRFSQTLFDAFVSQPAQDFVSNLTGDLLGGGDQAAQAQAEIAALQQGVATASTTLTGAGTSTGTAILTGAQQAGQVLITSAQQAAALLQPAQVPAAAGARRGGFRGLGLTEARSLAAQGLVTGAQKGAVLNGPTFVSQGLVAGEGSKPEAIVPLGKTSSGELGIQQTGGSGQRPVVNNNNVNINVTTKDAESFGNSEGQILNQAKRKLRGF